MCVCMPGLAAQPWPGPWPQSSRLRRSHGPAQPWNGRPRSSQNPLKFFPGTIFPGKKSGDEKNPKKKCVHRTPKKINFFLAKFLAKILAKKMANILARASPAQGRPSRPWASLRIAGPGTPIFRGFGAIRAAGAEKLETLFGGTARVPDSVGGLVGKL